MRVREDGAVGHLGPELPPPEDVFPSAKNAWGTGNDPRHGEATERGEDEPPARRPPRARRAVQDRPRDRGERGGPRELG